MKIRRSLLVPAIAVLAGCATVGPNYVRPDVPTPSAWHAVGPGPAAAAEP
ncbi:MAG: hypothetical protein HY900_10055, partial [Deltaproteobacteria bacterium]|nr:hypothetical protein [Deltaproteobacteria bacterium]